MRLAPVAWKFLAFPHESTPGAQVASAPLVERQAPRAEAEPTGKLKHRPARTMVHAVGWMALATWSSQVVTWVSTIVVARLLTAADYGLYGMANVFFGLLITISEFGLGSAVIALPNLTREQLAQLNTVAVLSGIALFGVSSLAAFPIAVFFRADQLPAVIIALSLAFVITSFKVVPDALLQREFHFRLVAKIEGYQALATALGTLGAALLGAAYWSFVIGALTGRSLGTLIALGLRRHPFAWPKWSELRYSLTFSWYIVVTRVAWYIYSNADFLVAGRVLGQTALGSYNIAWTLARLPIQRITNLVSRVLPSYFSKAQADDATLRHYLLKITEVVLLITLPLSIGVVLLGDELVAVVLGPKWMNAVLPLRILALFVPLRSITIQFAPLLNVRGETRYLMWSNIAAAVYFPAAFYLGSHWGAAGIAAVWPLLYSGWVAPVYRRVFRQVPIGWRTYLAALRPAVIASGFMTASVLILKFGLPALDNQAMHLAMEVLGGGTAYFLALMVMNRGRLRQLYALLRPAT